MKLREITNRISKIYEIINKIRTNLPFVLALIQNKSKNELVVSLNLNVRYHKTECQIQNVRNSHHSLAIGDGRFSEHVGSVANFLIFLEKKLQD